MYVTEYNEVKKSLKTRYQFKNMLILSVKVNVLVQLQTLTYVFGAVSTATSSSSGRNVELAALVARV